MQVANERHVLFWDRLMSLHRLKADGEVVPRGGEDGVNVLRIFGGDGAGAPTRPFLRVVCAHQEVLLAYPQNWPVSISDDGLVINLFLIDQSNGRCFKRRFILRFFDERGARAFFEVYTASLPTNAARGQSFVAMRDGIEEEEEEESESEDDQDEDDESVDLLAKIKSDGKEKEEVEGNTTAGTDEMDELQRMLEEDANFGLSQNVWSPMYPSDFK